LRLRVFDFQSADATIARILIERFGMNVVIAFFSVRYFAWALATLLNRNVRWARQIGAAQSV
jgi:hypothetical protein